MSAEIPNRNCERTVCDIGSSKTDRGLSMESSRSAAGKWRPLDRETKLSVGENGTDSLKGSSVSNTAQKEVRSYRVSSLDQSLL